MSDGIVGHLVVLEAIRKMQAHYPLVHVLAAIDETDRVYAHVAPNSDTAVDLQRLNNALGKLAMGLVRLGTPDILVFRECDGQLFCGRITCVSKSGESVIIQMYPQLWLARQISARVQFPGARTVISTADLHAT